MRESLLFLRSIQTIGNAPNVRTTSYKNLDLTGFLNSILTLFGGPPTSWMLSLKS